MKLRFDYSFEIFSFNLGHSFFYASFKNEWFVSFVLCIVSFIFRGSCFYVNSTGEEEYEVVKVHKQYRTGQRGGVKGLVTRAGKKPA